MKSLNTKQIVLLVVYVVATLALSFNADMFLRDSFFGELGLALIITSPTLIFLSWTVVTVLLFKKFDNR